MVDPIVKELTRLNPFISYFTLILDWAIIFSAVWFSLTFQGLVPYVLAAFVIASRQHALLILMHEAAHRRLSNNSKLNDFIGDYFAAIPVFMGVAGYRAHHAQHHSYLNTDRDPDWKRKINLSSWQFPKTPKSFVLMLVAYLFGGGSLKEWSSLVLIFCGISAQKIALRPLVVRLLYYGFAIALVSYFGHWTYLLAYWLIPYVFVMLLFQRIRSIAEHFGTPRTHKYNESRNVICTALERFFLGPHNVCYHLDHHIYPSVPFYNLPKLHEYLMQDKEYCNYAHQNTSYVFPSSKPVLKDLLSENTKEGKDAA